MVFKNVPYSQSLSLNDKKSDQNRKRLISEKLTRRKFMFYLACVITLIIVLIHSIIETRRPLESLTSFLSVSLQSTILRREPTISIVFINIEVPPIVVGLYYLPLNESKMRRYCALEEQTHGTKDKSGYPFGAQLLSNESEYKIPSDRVFDEKSIYQSKKYFQEIPNHPHIDARFGERQHIILNNLERVSILRGIFTAWSEFTDEKQIPSWIAHGTLLSWWWGGSLFPWDSDIDMQMNANFLYVLARFNNTFLSNQYLIDVNPYFRVRHPQKFNCIDARLIDMHSGYFIDITGVADIKVREPTVPQNLLLCDKHKHKTFYSDFHPLVRTQFEGIATWRPYHVENCLVKEYGQSALVQTTYKGYSFVINNATWVWRNVLPQKIPQVSQRVQLLLSLRRKRTNQLKPSRKI